MSQTTDLKNISPFSTPLEVQNWGEISYTQALEKQLLLLEELDQKIQTQTDFPGYLVVCSHPAVVTTGRQTQADDIFSWTGEVVEISRGGRATYHGPSQIVVYPIINLKMPRKNRGAQEVRGYLRALEEAIVATLKHYNISAIGKTSQKLPGQVNETDETGVWIGSKKIASLGIAVKKWISFHGAALNFSYDPSAFQGIRPCGFTSDTMISVEQLSSQKIEREEFEKVLIGYLLEKL